MARGRRLDRRRLPWGVIFRFGNCQAAPGGNRCRVFGIRRRGHFAFGKMSPVGTEFDVSEGYGKFTSAKQRPPVGVGRISTSSAPCGAASESLIQPTAVWPLARPALPKAKLPWGTFPSRGRLLEDAATITLAFPFRGRWIAEGETDEVSFLVKFQFIGQD